MTEEDVYVNIVRDLEREFGGDETTKLGGEIFRAKFEAKKAVHCFFSPSKSTGWARCAAYLERSKQWNGNPEPAVRGTIIHKMLSLVLSALKGDKGCCDFRVLDDIMWYVFGNPDWLGRPGVMSALCLIEEAICLGLNKIQSEKFIMSPTLGLLQSGKRFGGSIDMLYLDEEKGVIGIYDLKTGRHPVSPNSPQLMCYAMLAADEFGREKDWNFVLGIAQDGELKKIEVSHEEFLSKRKSIEQQFERYKKYKQLSLDDEKIFMDESVESEGADCFCPGDYCRFCKGCYKRQY